MPTLQPLAGQGGVISASGNHLFVDVPPARMTAIKQAVAQFDVESRTYRIRVDRSGSSHSSSGRLEAGGSVGGDVRIQRSRPRQIGQDVEFEITPHIASLRNDGVVEFQELATTVRVVSGEWFNLGGTM